MLSNLKFCPLAWHFCSDKNSKKLDKVQERCAEMSCPGWRTSCLMAQFVTKKKRLSAAGCKLDRDAVWSVSVDGGHNCLGGLVGVHIDVRLSHVLCGVKLIDVTVGCDDFSTKFCTSKINLSFCFLSCSIASSCVIYLLLRLVTCLISTIVDIR